MTKTKFVDCQCLPMRFLLRRVFYIPELPWTVWPAKLPTGVTPAIAHPADLLSGPYPLSGVRGFQPRGILRGT